MANRNAQDVDATNQDYIRYDQVAKKQEYHLAEAGHYEAFDEEYRIRTCDIGRFLHGNEDDKRRFASELGEALQGIGFAILEGHDMDAALYDEAEVLRARYATTLARPANVQAYFEAQFRRIVPTEAAMASVTASREDAPPVRTLPIDDPYGF